MEKTCAVLGMGRFGSSVAMSLEKNGVEVMGVDHDADLLAQYSSRITYALCAELADEAAVRELGLGNMDNVVVSMGKDLESSILCVMVAKEAGVHNVIAKARSKRMGAILKKVGADSIIYPEEESGIRLARALASSHFLDLQDLPDNMVLVKMKPRPEWVGKNFRELQLRERFHVNVIGIHTDGSFSFMPDPDQKLEKNDIMSVLTLEDNLKQIR